MKSFPLFLCTFILFLNSFGQKQYRVIFHDTTKFLIPDSMSDIISQAFRKLSGSDSIQFNFDNILQTNDRIVTTHKDYTVIKIDRNSIDGGEVMMNGKEN